MRFRVEKRFFVYPPRLYVNLDGLIMDVDFTFNPEEKKLKSSSLLFQISVTILLLKDPIFSQQWGNDVCQNVYLYLEAVTLA